MRLAPDTLRGRDRQGGGVSAAGRTQAVLDGDRSALWHRTRFRVAGQGGAERLRARRAQLFEKTDQGASRDQHLRRYACRLVRSICTCSESRSGLCLACIDVHRDDLQKKWPILGKAPALRLAASIRPVSPGPLRPGSIWPFTVARLRVSVEGCAFG